MKLAIKRLLSYLPSPLPVGLSEFHAWADDIVELSGKFADEDSLKFAISNNLIHLPHTVAYKPKQYFVRTLRKAAANQVASQVFQDIKQKQHDAMLKQQAEATASIETTVLDEKI
jgi:hypothetical protein